MKLSYEDLESLWDTWQTTYVHEMDFELSKVYRDKVKDIEKQMAEYLTKKSTGWFKGCGCGQKAGDLVTPPVNSVDAWIPQQGEVTGPVTGIRYYIVPNTTSIDIDRNDFEAWVKDGFAHQPRPGFKGIITRIN